MNTGEMIDRMERDAASFIIKDEDDRCGEFMEHCEAYFALYDKEAADMARFIAEKCFRVGYKRGVIGALDAFEESRKKIISNN